jgi:hypothetical protein
VRVLAGEAAEYARFRDENIRVVGDLDRFWSAAEQLPNNI